MKITKFVGRKKELKFLEEKYNENKFNFIVVYGRRRIGKTTLIKKFLENKKGIYFLAREVTMKENIRTFKESAREILDLEHIKEDWIAIFKEISKYKEKLVIVIDEFPYLIKEDRSVISTFQYIIDEYLQNTNHLLIVLGSSISTIEKDIISYKSPLYGRRTGQIKLKEFNILEVLEFLEKTLEESIKIYGVVGGIPLYLNFFRENKDFWELLHHNIIEENSFLREEGIFLLKQEFNDISTYICILESISLGYNTLGEIINYCGLRDKASLSPYLNKLILLDLIKKEFPIFSKRKKKAKYVLCDKYFSFWLRYIYRNMNLSEEKILSIIKKDFNQYLGFIFEDVCRELLSEKYITGKWWHKDKEIDIVSYNDKLLIFGECKWKDKINPKQICKELVEKINYVNIPSNLKNNKVELWIFAKSFKEKISEFEEYLVKCIDLKDLEKYYKS